MSKVDSVQVYGRKKNAVAVSYCKRGGGLIHVNGKPLELLEPEGLRLKCYEAILVVGKEKFADVDMRIRVKGGGHVAQVYAIRQAMAKSLVAYYQKCECPRAPPLPLRVRPACPRRALPPGARPPAVRADAAVLRRAPPRAAVRRTAAPRTARAQAPARRRARRLPECRAVTAAAAAADARVLRVVNDLLEAPRAIHALGTSALKFENIFRIGDKTSLRLHHAPQRAACEQQQQRGERLWRRVCGSSGSGNGSFDGGCGQLHWLGGGTGGGGGGGTRALHPSPQQPSLLSARSAN